MSVGAASVHPFHVGRSTRPQSGHALDSETPRPSPLRRLLWTTNKPTLSHLHATCNRCIANVFFAQYGVCETSYVFLIFNADISFVAKVTQNTGQDGPRCILQVPYIPTHLAGTPEVVSRNPTSSRTTCLIRRVTPLVAFVSKSILRIASTAILTPWFEAAPAAGDPEGPAGPVGAVRVLGARLAGPEGAGPGTAARSWGRRRGRALAAASTARICT